MRKKGYWRALAEDLAAYLKKKRGVEKVGFIVFGSHHRAASQKIAQRLRENFPGNSASRGGGGTGSPKS